MSIPTGDINWWVAIEGVGDIANVTDSTRGTLLRFSMSQPSWDAADATPLYRAILVEGSLDVSGNDVSFHDGSASSGGLGFSLLQNDEVLSIFSRLRHVFTARLAAELDHDDTTIETDSLAGELDDTVGFVDREAILYGTGDGAGQYTGCVRGAYETNPEPHALVDTTGHKIYEKIKAINRRRVTLGYTPETATSYADEVVFRRYQIQDDGDEWGDTYDCECDGWLALMGDAPTLPKQWIGRYQFRVGTKIFFGGFSDIGVRQLTLPATLQRKNGRLPLAVNGDEVLVEVAGTIWRGELSALERDAADDSIVTVYTIMVDVGRDPEYGSLNSPIKLEDTPSMVAREVFVSDQFAPGNGAIGGFAATAALPLGGSNGNLLTSFLQLVTSTEWGANGDYDTAAPFGLGVPHTSVDIAGIEALRARSVSLHAPRLMIGREKDEGKDLLQILERDLRAVGMVISDSTTGLLTVAGMSDSELTTTATITDADLDDREPVGTSYGTALTIDSVDMVWDRYGDGTTRHFDYTDSENTAERLGPDQGDAIDAGSWNDRNIVKGLNLSWLMRWRNRLPLVRLTTGLGTNLYAGQSVNLTTAFTIGVDPDTKEPTRGVTNSRCHVKSVQPDIEKGTSEYVLRHSGIRYDNLGNIAGTLEVGGVIGGTIIVVQANVFVLKDPVTGVTTHPVWSVDNEAFEVDDEVQLVSEFGVHKAYGVVTSIPNTTTILVPLVVGSAVDGDYIIHRDWDNMTASQQARMAAYAKADDTIGINDAPGFQYEAG